MTEKEIKVQMMERRPSQPDPREGSSSQPRWEKIERQRVNSRQHKPFDVLRRLASYEERSQRLAEIVNNFNDYVTKIENKLFAAHLPNQLQEFFTKEIDTLLPRMQEDYMKALGNYKGKDKEKISKTMAKQSMNENIAKMQKINTFIDSYNENIYSVSKARVDIRLLQLKEKGTSFPEEVHKKFKIKLDALSTLLTDCDNETKKTYENNRNLAWWELESNFFFTKEHQMMMNLIGKQIAEMADHLQRRRSIDKQQKNFDKSIQNIQEKIQNMQEKTQKNDLSAIFHDKIPEIIVVLSQKFKDSYASIVDNYTKKISFEEKNETMIHDLTKRIAEINQDLDQWHHIQEASEELGKALPSVPEKYRPLVSNLADREERLVREAYRLILGMDERRNDLPDPRDCFEKVCGLLKKRPEILKDVYSKQTARVGENMGLRDERISSLIKRYSEVKEILRKEGLPSDHESLDNLKQEWEEHARSYEALLACFGDKYSYIHMEGLKENFNIYANFMDRCKNEISQSLEEGDLNTTEEWVNDFIDTHKAFDDYMNDYGWLGDTPIERFKRTFSTVIVEDPECKGRFIIKSHDEIGRGEFSNRIDVNKGEIMGVSNLKEHTDDWYFSDVVYAQIQLAQQQAGISQFVPTRWYADNVINPGTKSIAEGLLPDGKTEQTFQSGSKEFAAIAQTPTARSKFYLLKQYFPDKKVTSITVKRVLVEQVMQLHIDYKIGKRLSEGEKMAEQEDKHHGESSRTHEGVVREHQ